MQKAGSKIVCSFAGSLLRKAFAEGYSWMLVEKQFFFAKILRKVLAEGSAEGFRRRLPGMQISMVFRFSGKLLRKVLRKVLAEGFAEGSWKVFRGRSKSLISS